MNNNASPGSSPIEDPTVSVNVIPEDSSELESEGGTDTPYEVPTGGDNSLSAQGLGPQILSALRQALESGEANIPDARRVWPPSAERLAFGKFGIRDGHERYLRIISVKWVSSEPMPPLTMDTKRRGFESGGWGFDVRNTIYDALQREPYLVIEDYDVERQPPLMFGPNGTSIDVPQSWLDQQRETARVANFPIRSKVIVPISQPESDSIWGILFIESRLPNINRDINDWQTFTRIASAFCAPFRLANVLMDLDGRVSGAQVMIGQIATIGLIMSTIGVGINGFLAASVLWAMIAGCIAVMMYVSRDTDITMQNFRRVMASLLSSRKIRAGATALWHVLLQNASRQESRWVRRMLLVVVFSCTSIAAFANWLQGIQELLLHR